ncbi:hypothetical protein ACFLVI_00800 [Chloroflexota bacterium]
MRLTKQEQETIINWNDEESVAYIYTCNQGWISHLEKLGFQPNIVHKDGRKIYAKEFIIPKRMIRKPPLKRKNFQSTDAQLELWKYLESSID